MERSGRMLKNLQMKRSASIVLIILMISSYSGCLVRDRGSSSGSDTNAESNDKIQGKEGPLDTKGGDAVEGPSDKEPPDVLPDVAFKIEHIPYEFKTIMKTDRCSSTNGGNNLLGDPLIIIRSSKEFEAFLDSISCASDSAQSVTLLQSIEEFDFEKGAIIAYSIEFYNITSNGIIDIVEEVGNAIIVSSDVTYTPLICTGGNAKPARFLHVVSFKFPDEKSKKLPIEHGRLTYINDCGI